MPHNKRLFYKENVSHETKSILSDNQIHRQDNLTTSKHKQSHLHSYDGERLSKSEGLSRLDTLNWFDLYLAMMTKKRKKG